MHQKDNLFKFKVLLTLLLFSLSSSMANSESAMPADCDTKCEYFTHAVQLENAANAGDAEAQANLALIYYHQYMDYEKGLFWYKKSAKQGVARAQHFLGYVYENGIDYDSNTGEYINQDYQQAFKWYLKAAKQGFPPAQYAIALAYADGRGVKQNNKKALYWVQKAADGGYFPAQDKLQEFSIK